MSEKVQKACWYGKKQVKTMLIAVLLFFLSSCMVANTTNTVLPYIAQVREWNVSILMMMAGVALLISVLFAIILGRIVVKTGPKKVIIVTLILAAGSALLYGFAGNMKVFILAMILNAIFAAGYQTVGVTALINNWFPRMKGIVLGWVTMGIIASDIIWIPMIPKALAAFGAEHTLLGISIIYLVMALLVALLIRNTPEEEGTYPDGDPTGIEDLEKRIAFFREYKSPYTIGRCLRTPRVWQIIVGWGLLWLVSIAYISQEVLRFVSIGYDADFAAGLMGMAGISGLVGSWLFGFLDTKIGTKKASQVFVVWILIMFVIALFHDKGFPFVVITAVGIACAIGGVCNLIPSMTGTCFGRLDFAAANAVINPLTMAFCAIGVFMGGFFSGGPGYQAMYLTCIVLIIISGIIVFTTKDTMIGRKDEE